MTCHGQNLEIGKKDGNKRGKKQGISMLSRDLTTWKELCTHFAVVFTHTLNCQFLLVFFLVVYQYMYIFSTVKRIRLSFYTDFRLLVVSCVDIVYTAADL